MRAEPPGGPPFRVVLSMIVRNESLTIFRCLGAALPFVDGFVIVDTGSTDDTVGVAWNAVRNWHPGEAVPGVILEEPFVDFGESRTRAARLAREWALEQGFDPGRTYLLLLDADMVLRGDPSAFRAAALPEPYYQLEQRSAGTSWWNHRLLCLSHAWSAVGVTHEYWRPEPDAPLRRPAALPPGSGELYIDDRGDGGSKTNKLERDVALLTASLERDPADARAWFYLGQSHFELGQYDEAAMAYRRRVEFPEHPEERWHALLKLGRAEFNRGRFAAGTFELLRAFEEEPGRAAPLMALSRGLTGEGMHHLALLFARAARGMTPDPRELFLDPSEALYWPEFQIGRAAASLGHRSLEGLLAIEQLLADRGAPDDLYYGALYNSRFFAPPIARKPAAVVVPEPLAAPAGPVLGGPSPNTTRYVPKNPSLFWTPSELYTFVNLVNYRHERGVVFESRDPDRVSRTIGVLLRAESARLALPVTVEWPPEWPEREDLRIRGLEDVRVFRSHGVLRLTATSSHATGQPQVVMGRLDETSGVVSDLVHLRWEVASADRTATVEKNWLPWPYHDELYFIYEWEPFTLLRLAMWSGACQTVLRQPAPFRAAGWRGGAPPIRMPNGNFLAVVHQVLTFSEPAPRRVYLHRFVELSAPGPRCTILRYSGPWTLEGSDPNDLPIEYVTGLAPEPGAGVLLGYGREESSALVCRLSWSDIAQLLRFPHDPPKGSTLP